MAGEFHAIRLKEFLWYKPCLRPGMPSHQATVAKIGTTCGVLIAPSGLFAIILPIFGSSPASVAVWSAVSTLLLATCYYKHYLSFPVKLWVILIFILGSFLVVFLLRNKFTEIFFERSITKATGIIEYAPHADEYMPKLGGLIRNSKTDIFFSGVNFYLSLPKFKDDIIDKLAKGVDVKFLIFDPLSLSLPDLAAGFSQTPEQLQAECDITIATLREIQQSAMSAKSKGKLSIRLFSSPPRTRIYIFDKDFEEGHTFFIPHIDGKNSAHLPGFLAKNITNGVAQEYFPGVDRLWGDARSWDEFLPLYDARNNKR